MLPWPALPTVTLPGLAFSQPMKLLQIVRRHGLPWRNHERRNDQQRYRLEIRQQVVGQIVVGGAGDDMGAVLPEADGVSVGRGAHGRPTPCVPPAPVTFSMMTVWPATPASARRGCADHVGRAACRERHDDGDRVSTDRFARKPRATPRATPARSRSDAESDGAEVSSRHSGRSIRRLDQSFCNSFASHTEITAGRPSSRIALRPRRSAPSTCAESVTFSP